MSYCSECSASVPDDVTECPTCGASLDIAEQAGIKEQPLPELDLEKLQATLNASLSPTYEVLKPIGHGGMGAIFLAKEPALKRLVAVKVLSPELAADTNARVRFEREARAAAAISHPNIVRVFAVGETKRTKLPYIIMQFVEGPNLDEWRLRRGRLSEREARRVIGEVAAALAAAHERGLVHRDVKPSNVLLESETGRAFVVDFGVSAALSGGSDETKLTHTGAIIGTPTYMSPEQSASDPITPNSDVYSLGVLAHELLTGHLPLSANSAMGWAAAHLRDTPTPTAERRPEISPALAQLVDRCLSKSPDDRPAANEIARGLLPSLETEIEWPPPGLQWMLGRGRIMNRLALLAAAGAAVATLALAFVPDVLTAGAFWLQRFRFTPNLPFGGERPLADLSNAAVLAMFVWQVALTIGLVVYGVAGLAFLSVASRFVERTLRQRALGWRFSTLIDLAVDYDGRSGLVLAGTADFASFKGSTRKSVLRTRRGASAAMAAGASWVIAAFAVRTLLLVTGVAAPETTHTLLTAFDATLILIPGGLLILSGFGFRFGERHILGKLGRSHSFDAEPGDIFRWYESLGDDAAKPAPVLNWAQDRVGVWSLRLGRLALFLLIPVVAMAVALGTAATLTAVKFSTRFGSGVTELLAAIDRVDREDPIGGARSAWLPYLPPADAIPITLASEWILRLRLDARDPDAIPAYGVAPADFFDWNPVERRTETEMAFARAFAGEIPPDTIGLLESLETHPRTMLLRRLGSAPNIDLWNDPSFDGTHISDYPLRPVAVVVTEAARANVLTAVLATSRGNTNVAEQRMGENAGAAEHLLKAPDASVNLRAMALLSNQVLDPLAALRRAVGDAVRAATFEREARQVRLGARFGNAAGLTVDPTDFGRFIAAVTDTRIPAGYRTSWLRQGWAGLCAHPREILLGPSAERRIQMQAAAGSMTDIARISDYAKTFEAEWRWPATAARYGDPRSGTNVRIEDKLFLGPLLRVFACVIPDNSN